MVLDGTAEVVVPHVAHSRAFESLHAVVDAARRAFRLEEDAQVSVPCALNRVCALSVHAALVVMPVSTLKVSKIW